MIKVYRENNAADHGIPYKILIDNIPVFEIIEEEIKSVQLDPGKHKISVKSAKYKSNELDFYETEDGITEFLVEPDYANNAVSKFFTNTLYGKVGIKVSLKKEFYL